jgi:hypothetical protein
VAIFRSAILLADPSRTSVSNEKGSVGVTDRDWYDFLSSRPDLTEVKFWQPGGRTRFNALAPGVRGAGVTSITPDSSPSYRALDP